MSLRSTLEILGSIWNVEPNLETWMLMLIKGIWRLTLEVGH